MLFLLTSRTRPGLSQEQYEALAALAREFYANIPAGIKLRGNWVAADGSQSFALLEADDLPTVDALYAPFRPYVDTDIVAVNEIDGWQAD